MSGHILVVDDDPGIRDVVCMVLGDEGFPVSTASDGRQALDRIADDRPCLVLLDLNMPVMTGWEVLAQLQETKSTVPVVFMTAGKNAQSEASRCRAAGYLAKPFDLSELIATVERFARPAAS